LIVLQQGQATESSVIGQYFANHLFPRLGGTQGHHGSGIKKNINNLCILNYYNSLQIIAHCQASIEIAVVKWSPVETLLAKLTIELIAQNLRNEFPKNRHSKLNPYLVDLFNLTY